MTTSSGTYEGDVESEARAARLDVVNLIAEDPKVAKELTTKHFNLGKWKRESNTAWSIYWTPPSDLAL